MNRNERRRHNASIRKLPVNLTAVDESEWPATPTDVRRFAVWRSRKYLVQLYKERDDIIRMTVCRVTVGKGGRWNDDISWDELQVIKRLIDYGDRWAVEIFPPDRHLVNVANMRHLWMLTEEPSYGWRNG